MEDDFVGDRRCTIYELRVNVSRQAVRVEVFSLVAQKLVIKPFAFSVQALICVILLLCA